MKKLFLILFFLLFALSTNAEEDVHQNVNELSLGITVYTDGSYGKDRIFF